MKRVIFIAVAMCTLSTVVANTTIQTEFNGIVLGESSRNEVLRSLSANGQLTSTEETDSLGFSTYIDTYEGKYMHEGMQFDKIMTSCIDDTIVWLAFNGVCDDACVDYGKPFIQKIHSKYGNLANADSSTVVISATQDVEGCNVWSRRDDESVVLTMYNDSSCVCTYFAESRMIRISVNVILNQMKNFMPDYAEENKVYGVGGVKFGDSRANVKNVILPKSRDMSEDAHSMTFYDIKIGGRTYDFATFYFTSNQGLVSVNLQKAFYEWRDEEALMLFESIKSQYGRKYTNLKMLVDEDDEKLYTCGAYIDGYDYPPVLISFQKGLSKGGDIMCYVQVDYYGFRRENLYDDEI